MRDGISVARGNGVLGIHVSGSGKHDGGVKMWIMYYIKVLEFFVSIFMILNEGFELENGFRE